MVTTASIVGKRSVVTELRMSTSPRCTWLWSPDEATAERLRAVLDEAGK